MPRPKDFATKYAPKIFAIDPAFSFHSTGCGWAILNENSGVFGGSKKLALIHCSGVLKPFSNESSLKNMLELTDKLKEIWHADAGFSAQPKALVIERPVIYPKSPVNPMNLMELTLLCGILIKTFKPKQVFVPVPREWKSIKTKEDTRDNVLSLCDSISLSNIKRDIDYIAMHKRHNMFDAMGLGIYGIRVLMKEINLPKMYYMVD